ncbi:hypothetical protein BD413DRAFT_494507 [Trametes elegans]|nr:hypothetical protein BD413DRAFT_494507 [Trametes elegans]
MGQPPVLNLQSATPAITEVDEDNHGLYDEEEDAVGRDVIELDFDLEAHPSHSRDERPGLQPKSPVGPTVPPDHVEEPPLAGSQPTEDAGSMEHGSSHPSSDPQIPLREPPAHIQQFGGLAGSPMTNPNVRISSYHSYGANIPGSAGNLYAPFKSRMDWDLAQWAKRRGSGSTAFTELLEIKGFSEALGISYKNTTQLNAIIDKHLPNKRPAFMHHEVKVMGEKFNMFTRNILECIIAIYERHYANADQTKAVEVNTPGATIIPIILSSDKTQIMLFRNKSAYPVYLTIGNLPKSIRRKPSRQGQILLAYLPTTRLEHIASKASRRRTLANLFHACMGHIVKPLEQASVDGVPMISGDGVWRRCHPIVAIYVGDYPEQCLVTGAYTGDCPVCDCPHDKLEVYPPEYKYRDSDAVLDALGRLGTDDFVSACHDANVKPIQSPFWETLPYLDIFQSITPDILHQLHQDVFKHLVSWLKEVCGTDEIDARVSRLPPNHSIRIFWKGISKLSHVSGAEHKQMSHFLLGVILDIPLPGGRPVTERLVCATRGLLDFLYLAQYLSHTDETLMALDHALAAFHNHCDIFITLGARTAFNIPKLHFLLHYTRFVKLFGTTDNYNTEATERLHIDLAKDAYRATNHKDEYPQMTKWLEHHEKMSHHTNYVLWRLQQADVGPATLSAHHDHHWSPPNMACALNIKMTRHPTHKAIPLADILSPASYGATFFIATLARFVVQWRNPEYSDRQVEDQAQYVHLPVNAIAVYHWVKFWNKQVHGNETLDSIHVHLARKLRDDRDIIIPARFNTALVRVDRGLGVANQGLGQGDAAEVSSGQDDKSRIPLSAQCPSDSQMGGKVPLEWSSDKVLDVCDSFYLNTFKDVHSYFNLY